MSAIDTPLKRIMRAVLPQPAITMGRELFAFFKHTPTESGELSDFHFDVIRPEILRRWHPIVIEIGVRSGGHTRLLLNACLLRWGKLIAIDPCPDTQIALVARLHPRCLLIREISLEALPKLVEQGLMAHVVVVDGDHNYFTVLHELRLIDRLLAPGGVIFLHDVGWPYGRRDMYYDPDRIPPHARHAFAMLGISPDQSELQEQGGVNCDASNALVEGGPKNGVLTAIEDFVAKEDGRWTLETRDEQFGVGILRRA